MSKDTDVLIEGQKLSSLREDVLFFTQEELAAGLQMSARGVQRLERFGTRSISLRNFRKLAELAKIPPDELRLRLAPAQEERALPSGLSMGTRHIANIVPLFHVGISADRRRDKVQDSSDKNLTIAVRDTRAFVITIDGDCQEPKWKDGEMVVFSYDAMERDHGIIEGKSYYLQFTDGMSTFKRVFFDETDPDVFVLRCWNRKEYPKDMKVGKQEVVNIAKAIGKHSYPEAD